jgi:hypothetical protein
MKYFKAYELVDPLTYARMVALEKKIKRQDREMKKEGRSKK